MNRQSFDEVTGSTPDKVIIQRQQAERIGKHFQRDQVQRVGLPLPKARILQWGAYPVALWRVKTFQIVTQGGVTRSVIEWQEHGIYALPDSHALYLIKDETAVEVSALHAVIRAMFDARQDGAL